MNEDLVNKDLKIYLKKNIFPKYKKLYAHGLEHINYVIHHSFIIAKDYDVDPNMIYCIACYHDLGLLKISTERNNHAIESGKILQADQNLKRFFITEQIQIMKEAVEEHSGDQNQRPRNIYGEIVSDADRDLEIPTLAKRQLQTSIKYYPELTTFEEHFERCYKYILERNKKIFNLWTKNDTIKSMMTSFKNQFLDKETTKKIYRSAWEKIESAKLKEKFINYYKD